jgi:Flp pilus assembly protein TadD
MLARTYDREGLAAVNAAVNDGVQRRIGQLPSDKPIPECLKIGLGYLRSEDYANARQIYVHVLERDSGNAEAMCRLGIVAACTGLPMLALELMTKATATQPRNVEYHSHLAELYRRLNRLPEAENSLREARLLAPHDPNIASCLGLILAQQGRGAEGLNLCQAAANAMPVPIIQNRLATVLASQGLLPQAKVIWQLVLVADPANADAAAGLKQLQGLGI